MPIKINTASQSYTLLSSNSGPTATSNALYRGEYTYHQLYVKSSTGPVVDFNLYTSNDGDNWVSIKTKANLETTYDTSNLAAVMHLTGCYPWLQIARDGSTAGVELTATIFSTGKDDL